MIDPQPPSTLVPPEPEPRASAGPLAHARWLVPLFFFGAVLAVYRTTLMPGLGYWDTGEFQAVPYLLGIAHPTGYPFYTLIGKLASYWPEGSIAWRMNWFSALCGAGATTGMVLLARRLGLGWWAALAAGGLLAFDVAFWQTSLRADPHTLHVGFVMAILIAGLCWYQTRRFGWLVLAALLTGLGLGNHGQLVMFVPAVAVLALWAEPALLKAPKRLAALVGAGLAGLSVYAYIPLRAMQNPPINYAHPTTWARFKYVVTGEEFRSDMVFLSPQALSRFVSVLIKLPAQLGEWLTPVGAWAVMGFAIVGLQALWKRDLKLFAFLFLAWLIPLFQACTYNNGDVRRYFFSPTALLILFAAYGAWSFVQEARAHYAAKGQARAAQVVVGVMTVLGLLTPPALAYANWTKADLHWYSSPYHETYGLVGSLKPHAVIASFWLYSTSLWYVRFVDQFREDIRVLDDRNIKDEGFGDVFNVVETFIGKRPVYVLRCDAGEIATLKERYELRLMQDKMQPAGTGELYEVMGRKR